MSNQAADAVFDALGEPVRRRILELLHEGPTPVGELAARGRYLAAPGGMGVAVRVGVANGLGPVP
jgi:DNA-binding transcriptional ArsR family regulator